MLTPQAILIRFYGLTAVAYCSKTRSSVRRKELTGKRPYILSGLGPLYQNRIAQAVSRSRFLVAYSYLQIPARN